MHSDNWLAVVVNHESLSAKRLLFESLLNKKLLFN